MRTLLTNQRKRNNSERKKRNYAEKIEHVKHRNVETQTTSQTDDGNVQIISCMEACGTPDIAPKCQTFPIGYAGHGNSSPRKVIQTLWR